MVSLKLQLNGIETRDRSDHSCEQTVFWRSVVSTLEAGGIATPRLLDGSVCPSAILVGFRVSKNLILFSPHFLVRKSSPSD